jgi:hypothetical protein
MQKQYSVLNTAFNERDRLMNLFKIKYEEEKTKLTEAERNLSSMEI